MTTVVDTISSEEFDEDDDDDGVDFGTGKKRIRKKSKVEVLTPEEQALVDKVKSHCEDAEDKEAVELTSYVPPGDPIPKEWYNGPEDESLDAVKTRSAVLNKFVIEKQVINKPLEEEEGSSIFDCFSDPPEEGYEGDMEPIGLMDLKAERLSKIFNQVDD